MCDCITRTDELLKERGSNTELICAFPYWAENGTIVLNTRMEIAVQKADKKNRKRPDSLMASYCPVCGEKYPEKPQVESVEQIEEATTRE